MAFGKPTKYWKLDIDKVDGGTKVYDEAVQKASDVYVSRMVSLQVLLLFLEWSNRFAFYDRLRQIFLSPTFSTECNEYCQMNATR